MFNKCLGEKYGFLAGNFEETVAEAGEGRGKGVGGKRSKQEGQEQVKVVSSPVTLLHALDSCETFDTMVRRRRS